MNLNDLDFKIVMRQKNPRRYVDVILRNDFNDFFRYLVTNDLYDKTGIPEDELELYSPAMSKVWFKNYIEKKKENSIDNRDKKLYDLYVDINTNANADNDRFYLFILNYYKIAKEIPDKILEKYIQKYDNGVDPIVLANGFISVAVTVPPDMLLKHIISTKEGRFDIIKNLNNQLMYIKRYNTVVNRGREQTIKDTLTRINELIDKKDLNTESFKSFFYKKIK